MENFFKILRVQNSITITNKSDGDIIISLRWSPTCNLDESYEAIFSNSVIEAGGEEVYKLPAADGLYKFIIESPSLEKEEVVYMPQYNVHLTALIEDIEHILCGCGCVNCPECDGESEDLLTVLLKLISYNIINRGKYSDLLSRAHECVSCDILTTSNCNLLKENVIGNSTNTKLLRELIAFYYLCFYYVDIQYINDINKVKEMYNYSKIYPCAKRTGVNLKCIENTNWRLGEGGGLEADVEDMKFDITNIQNNITNIEDNINDIEGTITNIESNITNIESNITNIESNITNIESNITNIESNITNIESNITNIESNISDIESNITNIESNISDIESNISDIENELQTVALPSWLFTIIGSNTGKWFKIGTFTKGMVSFTLPFFNGNCILFADYAYGYVLSQSRESPPANLRIGNNGELYVNLNRPEPNIDVMLTSINKSTEFTPITPVVGYSLEEIEATTKAAVIELALKQNKDDESLQTTDKTVVGAINEVKTQVDGKIDGPSSSTNNAIARFDGITGKVVQDSNVLIDDSGNVVISGNATINGTLTTINSETLQVNDKNIEIAKVDTPTDDTADGGGITLLGSTNKTIEWVKQKLSWVFNQGVEIVGNLVVSGTVDGRNIAADGSKLDGIELGAQVNVNADWDATTGDAEILNKPTDITDLSTHASSELSDGSDLVKGPASATDNTLPRFDLTTGKLLQAGGSITNLDNGNVGIANNNPTDKLHVIGNIRSSAVVHAGTKVVIASKVEQVYDAVNQSLKFNFL